jgi:hypothetical protein
MQRVLCEMRASHRVKRVNTRPLVTHSIPYFPISGAMQVSKMSIRLAENSIRVLPFFYFHSPVVLFLHSLPCPTLHR